MTRTRCAIYTRKSSEEGLDQDYNSLDAQRDACEAYVTSQKHEGWSANPTRYDDGGWSGGSMERPALKLLMADIAAGRVDIVVVYKVDRLTRSLSDFARMVDLFDRHNVSFVSVTQAFNTTSSMGRLTLNVLLSFAQFEREVTGERIRDKIAASKKRGMWMGGYPPLGYDPDGRTLAVNEAEADIVRHIFRRYLDLGSVHRLAHELEAEGIRSKQWASIDGKSRGGSVMGRGPLFHMLRNRVYIGEIVHGKHSWPGLHDGIVDQDLFDAVQARLDSNAVTRRVQVRGHSPLTGLLFDAEGNRMSPVASSNGRGRKYSYYVSSSLQKGKSVGPEVIGRVPSTMIDDIIIARLRCWSGRTVQGWTELRPVLRRVEVHAAKITVDICPDDRSDWAGRIMEPDIVETHRDEMLRITIPVTLRMRGGKTWLIEARSVQRDARPNRALIAGLHRAHFELGRRGIDMTDPRHRLAGAIGIADPYIRKLCMLAFLAPDIQKAILGGNQPVGMTLAFVLEQRLPLDWVEQRRMLGFADG
jgi:site-specific DNA recombinase